MFQNYEPERMSLERHGNASVKALRAERKGQEALLDAFRLAIKRVGSAAYVESAKRQDDGGTASILRPGAETGTRVGDFKAQSCWTLAAVSLLGRIGFCFDTLSYAHDLEYKRFHLCIMSFVVPVPVHAIQFV